MTKKQLTKDERERYSRQMIIPGFGEGGQLKLKNSHVVIAGLGGLGSPAALYLVAAGVGHLTILDAQRVELSNLNRQVLHWHADIDRSKAESAVGKLSALNPDAKIDSMVKKLTSKNTKKLLKDADVVLDGMDNYPARYLINEACVRRRIPFVHGAIEGFIGQLSTIFPGRGPCLKCIIPKEPPKKPVFPVLGATPGVIGCLEAMEAIKLITGIGEPLVGRMVIFNGKDMKFDEMVVKRNPKCAVCGDLTS